jgi:hypothetical protein
LVSIPQLPHKAGYVVFLEESDASDASGPSLNALPGIFKGNAAQRDHWDFLAANVTQSPESCRSDVRRIPLLEYWGEDGEVRSRGSRVCHLLLRVTGHRNEGTGHLADGSWLRNYRGRVCVTRPQGTRNGGIDVHRGEVHAVGGAGDGDIGTGIDQDASGGLAALCRRVASNGLYGRVSQSLEFTAGKIFFAELNKIDAAACGLGDFTEESRFACGVAASKLFSISDVVEEQTSF